jgi:hypothetical protein
MPVDISKLFSGLQGKLVASLATYRKVVEHPGDKGTASEVDWVRLFRDHLPNRYSAAKATVIDSNGASSQSIDIVIFDRHFSFLQMESGGQIYVPAEAVYAVFEVKQSVNRGHFLYAGEKAASVRALHRTSASTTDIRGETPKKEPIRILAGLLALSSDWAPLAGEAARSALNEQSDPQMIDICCALDAGAWDAERLANRKHVITSCDANSSLLFLLLTIVRRLQAQGSVAPIDFSAYSRWIKSLSRVEV